MKKIILAPDSFKGTMTSREVCGELTAAIREIFPETEIVSLPVADGGEGSVDAFLTACGGERVSVTCTGPNGQRIEAEYGLLPDGTAVVEMSAAAGLPMANPKNPERTTTFGVGELLRHAAIRSARKIIMCLGGSATNDGGCGAAAACGVRFFDEGGSSFTPVGGTLRDIARIDLSGLDQTLAAIPIVTMCDIDNPLCGPTGAAAVFGPQKGADESMVLQLDEGLAHLADLLHRDCGVEVRSLPGAGAAGGMGAGMTAFFKSRLQMGIETVLDTVGFEAALAGADLVMTGEGCMDRQSLCGKVAAGVARRAALRGVPVVALVGDVGEGAEEIYALGVTAVFSINRVAVPYEQARLRSRRDLRAAAGDILRLCRALEIPGRL
ncbi:glycerate kinase [Oscillibacter sp.]|uniref:glycerate kinase family protein n=1 Tax=Oscillibacter sp. TaxID=1945593 RepID=UPI002897DC45|nr:glycerate kinase [Oscillibacter sp.]